jgi:hypothetical protein
VDDDGENGDPYYGPRHPQQQQEAEQLGFSLANY